jgi:hypothetical protein
MLRWVVEKHEEIMRIDGEGEKAETDSLAVFSLAEHVERQSGKVRLPRSDLCD